MGWSTSIHISTSQIAKVVAVLTRLRERQCLIGHSGKNWVGVYSEACESCNSLQTSKLASRISGILDEYVLGVILGEDKFEYWLFRKKKLMDVHPRRKLVRWVFRKNEREILRLATRVELKSQIESALTTDRRRRPHEILGVTEEQFIAESARDLARVQEMSETERTQMEEKYARLRPSHEEKFKTLCDAIGIEESNWNFSELLELQQQEIGKEMVRNMGLTLLR